MNNKEQEISNYFDSHVESFDGIYTGEKKLWFRLWDKLTRQNIIQRFDYTFITLKPIKDKTVLDIGCGSGRYCFQFAKLGAGPIYGIDISSKMIDYASKLCKQNILYSNCIFKTLNILEVEGKYDYVSAIGVFDYINNPENVMDHIRTLTNEKLVCSFPARISFRYPFRKLWFTLHNTPVIFYSKLEIIKLIKKSGFHVKDIKKLGPIYIVTAI